MKRQINFWLVTFLAISLVLPIYSMAQTAPATKLTLESSSGDRISGANVKTFSLGQDGNLVIYLDGPFTFASLIPDITVDDTQDSYTNSVPTKPATVTATQPTPGTPLLVTFKIFSLTSGTTFTMPVNPEPGVASFGGADGRTFSWNIGGSPPAAVGSYLAVFEGTSGTSKSQLVVMINVVPPGYTLTINASNGSVTKNPDQARYTISPVQTVQLTAVPASGYYFTGWSGDLSGTANPASIVMNGNKTIIATFTQTPTYTVSVSVVNSAGGSVSPSSQTVTSGGTATFTVTTNSGYTASVSEGTLSGTTWTIPNVTSTHAATITFTQPAQGEILPWNINSLSAASRITFNAGETKTFIARITSNVRGFEVVFYPMTDFIVTCNFKMALKPDGTPYQTTLGRTEFIGLWAGYDGSINLRVWTVDLGGIVFGPYIYPGDFMITMTADRAGWGYMNTSLH